MCVFYIREIDCVVMSMRLMHRDSTLTLEDEAFFDQFYREYKQLLYYFARRYVAFDACDDLVQDVLERLMKQSQTIKKLANESGKLTYYIRAATQSAVVDRLRSNGRVTVITYPPDVLDTIIEDRIAAQRVLFEDTYWDIQLLKEKLPEREWKLLEGKYMIGYSDDELGRLYGCSKDSVRMALTRVKRKSRKILFNNDEDGGESNEQ